MEEGKKFDIFVLSVQRFSCILIKGFHIFNLQWALHIM